MNNTRFNPREFLIELFKYYMEFLETDFKENRPPSRKVTIHNKDGLLTDIELGKYPKLSQYAIALLSSNFENNPLTNVGKEDFVVRLPHDIIQEVKQIQNNSPLFDDSISKRILEFLQKQKFQNKETVIRDVRDKIKTRDGLDIASYLSKYIVFDFYDELYDLWKNKQVLEKQDFYFYFFDIRFDSIVYPIFFIPVSIEHTITGTFNFEFDPVFLINKKAIQHVTEKFAEENQKEWKIDLPPRHIFLSNFESKTDLSRYLQGTLNEICDFLGLKPLQIDNPTPAEERNGRFGITNNCYLSLFDKSDEALLNDYEELLNLVFKSEDAKALQIFSKLSTDYLFENPAGFEREIETEYDGQSVSEKLAYSSPIPLNREQLEVLRAIAKEDCNLIIIEGPPGTGKSHTITSIIYNALLHKKSVLMTSDKKEALDVVEEKINGVLDKMKLEDFIQNPIVRLGKKDNTFAGIFKQINYDKIKIRFNTYKRHKEKVEKEIDGILATLKKNINNEVEICSSTDAKQISDFFTYDETFNDLWQHLIDRGEAENVERFSDLLLRMWEGTTRLSHEYQQLSQQLKIDLLPSACSLSDLKATAVKLLNDIKTLQKTISDDYKSLLLAKEMTKDNLSFLEDCLYEIERIRKPVVGYLLCGKRVKHIENRFKERFFGSAVKSFRRSKETLAKEVQLYRFCQRSNEQWFTLGLDLFFLLKENACPDVQRALESVVASVDAILNVNEKLPITSMNCGIDVSNCQTILTSVLQKYTRDDILKLKEYLSTNLKLTKGSTKVVRSSFVEDRKALEKRLVFKMTNILDESVIDFRENYKNDAEALRKIIRARKQIPKEYLRKLVEAFPCIIVNIRELGEFIPLEPNIFDIVIIDEASQVSIAQAFPAILRAKKAVVLGDPKQYSNVKSHNASIAINNFLFNRVKDAFRKSISILSEDEQAKVKDKVFNFDIKNSILDFLRNITNYQCSLKKHFRGYIELIGFSNETFYQNSLQVMKIRGKSINEVIQFHYVEPDNRQEKYKNTNEQEADFILGELQRLRNSGFGGTVGVITPFTNQQKLISNKVFSSEDWQFYHDKFNLKIMTFDSCQGDEKDIIYYSMVERPNEDILKYIFPIKLSNLEDEEEGSLKAQRLNVGLSRAREGIRLVMSKKPEDIRGEIGKAIQFFKRNLDKPDEQTMKERMDSKSKMEPILFQYLIQTPFYKENKERCEIVPQFNIGKYIRQLNPLAEIPSYRTDFLFIYQGYGGQTTTAILEYDGFEHHFKDTGFVNEANFDRFYVEEDVERRKTIESYGYEFIRLNKFVLRGDPITFLDTELERIFKKKL